MARTPSADSGVVVGTAGEVLALIRDGAALTRPDIGRLTGLSRTAVAARVDALIGLGLVTESTALGAGVGRPAARLSLNAAAGSVGAVAIGRSRTRIAVCDLSGAVLGISEQEQEVAPGPDDVLPHVVRRLRTLLGKVGQDPSALLGVGVSVPGTVDHQAGCSINSPIMSGWDGVPIAPYFAGLTQAPLVVENDTNVVALAEVDGHLTRYRDALILKASTGLGAAIVAGGTLQHGSRGAAGDIGHVKSPHAVGLPCRCGEVGCLEAVAGGWALVRDLAEQGREVRHVRDVVALALNGDLAARRAVRAGGQAIGEVLATAVTMLDPAAIVVGGDMAPAYELLVAGMRETLYRDATAVASRDLDIVAATNGVDSGVLGTAALALEHVLRPAAVDARIAAARDD